MLSNNLDAKRLEIEREANEKRKTEDNLIEKMMYQMTIDKATQYSKKTLDNLRRRTRELVSVCKLLNGHWSLLINSFIECSR